MSFENTMYSISKKLGEGSFANVFLVNNEDTNYGPKNYALKVIDHECFASADRKKSIAEAKLMRRMKHENICACFDAFEFDNHLLLVTEFCPGGDMYCHLGNRREATPPEPVPEYQVLQWISQIAKALQYFHDRKILHRDLKTKNIFLKDDWNVKVGDLGIAKELDFTLAKAETFLGTPLYMSPEIFTFQPYSYKADIWSFGCCVYEMMTLRFAFESQSQHKMVQKIVKGKAPPPPSIYSSFLGELARKMLEKDPDLRPHASDILDILQNSDKKAVPKKPIPKPRRQRSEAKGSDVTDAASHLPERQAIVDALLMYFNNNSASGLVNGFDMDTLSLSRRGLSKTVKSISTRLPNQEDLTVVARPFGRAACDHDTVDNMEGGDTFIVKSTLKNSIKGDNSAGTKTNKGNKDLVNDVTSPKSINDRNSEVFPGAEADEVIKWPRQNLASCNVVENTDTLSEKCKPSNCVSSVEQKMSEDSKGRKKKRNYLKAASERKKSQSDILPDNKIVGRVNTEDLPSGERKQSLKSKNNGDNENSVTLFTRGQKVTFRNTEKPDENSTFEQSLSSRHLQEDLQKSWLEDIGEDKMQQAKQLVEIIKDEKLLQAQLTELLGWRLNEKYGSYIASLVKRNS